MSNSITIPVPVGDGRGAAVAVDTLGVTKTITVSGNLDGVLIVEASTGGPFHQVLVFSEPGIQNIKIAAAEMRAFVQGYRSGSAQMQVSADPDAAVFANLPVPAGNGTGALVDISTLGEFMTVTADPGDNFAGALEIEIGDATVLAQAFPTFVSRGYASLLRSATQARVRRRGFRADKPGSPVVWIGGGAPGGGGGGSPVDLSVLEGELWYPPVVPNAEDDEFNDSTLVGWTRNYTVSADPVNPRATFNTGDARESLDTRRKSWLILQPPADNVWAGIHKTFAGGGELPDGLYWSRGTKYFRWNSVVNNDLELGMMICGTSGGAPDLGNSVQIKVQKLNTGNVAVETTVWEASSLILTARQGNVVTGNFFEYFGAIKEGQSFYPMFGVGAGNWQTSTGVINYSGPSVLDRVYLYCRSNQNSTVPGVGVFGFDFFRYSPELILPS